MTSTTRIQEHYGRGGLGRAIVEALRAAGAPIEALSVDDLPAIDMNIADKEGLYREAHRMLRPGGQAGDA